MNKQIFVLFLSFLTFSVVAQTATKRTAEFNLENKIAIQGFERGSYLKGKPLKGKQEIAAT